ncbi:tail fiber protein [Chryseobacterium sp. Leaf394]|uniref:phage tail protein n=1 Tax=Chryseobacterium sp. Leaf394 TaxID=1736361 RepID=UPI00070111FE|nr:tail fiber protein [Chryseobacterium sp. Leaf394]KQS91783.1 hypothetical protein ASG21_04810 [Chryseobacterium sp. Leaf394]
MEGTMSEIRLFAGSFAPKYWAYCQGQTMQISTNQALFALLGTMYGGNGSTTFMLPNFSGRMPVGTGAAAGIKTIQLGQISGQSAITLTVDNMPTHTHMPISETASITAFSEGGDIGSPTNNTLASVQGLYSTEQADSTLKPIANTFNLSAAGQSQSINIQQPYLGMNYIICLMGIFPSRD